MKVCIFGAGAVGGHIATRLINAGADEISIVARGAMLKAIRERGGYQLMPEWETQAANHYLPRRITAASTPPAAKE